MKVLVLVGLLLAAPAFAQEPPPPPAPDSVDLLILPETGDPTAVAPLATLRTPISPSIRCNLDDVPAGPVPLVNPTRAIFDDPFTPGRFCIVPLPPLPPKTTMRAVAVFNSQVCPDGTGATAPCSSPRSIVAEPPTFQAQDEPPPPTCPAGAVALIVGDWSRTVSLGALGRVTYNLLLSTTPVTEVIVRFNGVEQDRLTASDLRKTGASYFRVSNIRGSYNLSVEARNAAGCSDGASRPMTVVVK